MSQTDIALIAEAAGVPGATRQSQARYEKGTQVPSAAYLAALAASGIDVLYILTGQRGAAVPLPPDVALLVERYRASPRELRDAALRVLLGGDAPESRGHQVKQKVSGNANQVVGFNAGVVNEKKSNRPGGKRQR